MSDSDFSNKRQLDAICDEFEEQWSLESRDIGSFLIRMDEQHRDQLLRMLLEVDVELRQKAGQEVSVNDYQSLGEQALAHVRQLLSAGFDETMTPPDSRQREVETAAAPSPQDEIKQIGRYQIKQQLGRGGFGAVYLAFDEQLERSVAIKVPHAEIVARAGNAESYLAEARTVANLDHPNIVPVHDVGSTDQHPCYVVSKYIEGNDLSHLLKDRRLSYRESTELVATAAVALHHAHKQGIVHRDIKPGNILIGNDGRPYVVDFGLALREQDNLDSPQGIMGTPAYMSPEQARGEGHRVDGRSDIFSLGVVFYELLIGRRPFRGDSIQQMIDQICNHEPKPLRQYDEQIPKELERICHKALGKKGDATHCFRGEACEVLVP